MRTTIMTAAAASVLALGSGYAAALPVSDQINEVIGGSGWTVAQGYLQFQSVTAGISGTLASIEVAISKEPDAVEDLFVGIYSMLGGVPGVVVAEQSFHASDILNIGYPDYDWISANFTTFGIALNIGEVFAIGLRSAAANNPPSYSERYEWQEGGNYAGGVHYINRTPIDGDLAFRTYIDSGNIPEPATLVLLGLGLAGLGFSRRSAALRIER